MVILSRNLMKFRPVPAPTAALERVKGQASVQANAAASDLAEAAMLAAVIGMMVAVVVIAVEVMKTIVAPSDLLKFRDERKSIASHSLVTLTKRARIKCQEL